MNVQLEGKRQIFIDPLATDASAFVHIILKALFFIFQSAKVAEFGLPKNIFCAPDGEIWGC